MPTGTKVLIFKKGKKEDPGNYRPVRVTSVPGEVMEKIILEGVEKQLEDNIVISHSQHGFMRGNCCLSNLISFYDKVAHLVGIGNPVDVIFLDFSKAFATASHSILLDKMSSTQLNNRVMSWKGKCGYSIGSEMQKDELTIDQQLRELWTGLQIRPKGKEEELVENLNSSDNRVIFA
ncbi:RNA-directed DNA polymerase from mobile element jockey-like protein [Pitangus sulphuratus]|nr:RNA-directed DNA polymerase from mobile element jockey-like protein [Pitangus sulphuratus]